MAHISENIYELRTARKLSQAELALKIRVSKSSISAYENGTRLPPYETLFKLAEFFHVSTDYLLGYSSKYMLDVSILTDIQRNALQEIVQIFYMQRKVFLRLFSDERYRDELLFIMRSEDFDHNIKSTP